MMFTIDLLKGQGLPRKSRPIVIALAAVPLLIPVLAVFATAACWQFNYQEIASKKSIINDNLKKVAECQADLDAYMQTQRKITEIHQQFGDVARALNFRIQATPLLTDMVAAIPDSLILTGLEMPRSDLRKKVADEKTQNVTYQTVVQRKIKLSVAGPSNPSTDQSVQTYIQSLRQSAAISRVAQDIGIAARKAAQIDDQPMSIYEIECMLKEQK